MRWTVHSERDLYRDQWVHVASADVELPDGRHLDHRIIRTAAPGAGLAVVTDNKVLLIWRHRFITDTWGWEIPHGSIRPGEDPADAAAREAEEETGWRPERPIRPLVYSQPSPGLMTSEHHIFTANAATHVGPPKDSFESDKVEWVPLADIPELINKRQIVAGTTLVALLYLLVGHPATG
ncbi:NUDIX hydrolase [Micromonospora antibiotica]|uniref:NUDIX domain-containing protein n=1 Tax=Micromonospora antibiotica TaxID=2807623 RepID=A0ABS3VFR9_9ACTN|nr:NUDIX domain-containing protein [Micromonospora antibiotica]MBO4164415.1 NUDIX domain-containing protein [Micromonospora antibiotica]